jgi:lipoyl(octanoyl) transferase
VSLLRWRFLGRVPYGHASRLQERLVEARRRGEAPDTLLLLEHPPVVTLGRGAHAENLLLDAADLAARGIELHEAGRGGDVTYHGPGQLVGYPVLALTGDRRDAHRYLRDIEEGLIATAAAFGVTAGRVPGLTGAWIGREKLAAIGVRIGTGWITSHGFALNVGEDLSGFETIVPCGIRDRGVTSLSAACGRPVTLEEVARIAATEVARALGFVAEEEAGTISSAAGVPA